ncbi:MAG: AIR carboxylase family protein, partial [Rivularia sp. ALOHA_DT_140]|nr:AIR carboxylase family protein [Rivularia sp. ALOHA_DT_140]
TVAIGNAKNAGLLAVQILAIYQPDLQEKVILYRQNLRNSVISKQEKLQKIGYQDYLNQM